jgi:hypothetical protein
MGIDSERISRPAGAPEATVAVRCPPADGWMAPGQEWEDDAR